MFFDGSIDCLEYPMLLFVGFGWNTDKVERFAVPFVMLPDPRRQLFANFVPEPFDPLPKLSSNQGDEEGLDPSKGK